MMIHDPENVVYKQFPEDFLLCVVGTYSTDTGVIQGCNTGPRALYEFKTISGRTLVQTAIKKEE